MMETNDLQSIRRAWQRVFRDNDAFAWPFRETFPIGRVFYPTDGLHLSATQYAALIEAIRQVGETGFFLSIVEAEGLDFLDRDWGHWDCDLPSYEAYCGLDLTLENALFSKDGRWGVLISHEMHAVASGTEDFMAVLADQGEVGTADLRALHDAWPEEAETGWLATMLPHVDPSRRHRSRP